MHPFPPPLQPTSIIHHLLSSHIWLIRTAPPDTLGLFAFDDLRDLGELNIYFATEKLRIHDTTDRTTSYRPTTSCIV